RASSRPGDLVLDCFAGSGTTAVAAQRLERRWIACDVNPGAIQVASRRLRYAILDHTPPSSGFSVWRIGDAAPAPQGDIHVRVTHHNDRATIAIEAYTSPLLADASRTLPDWRSIIDEILIDPGYDGTVFRPAIVDAPLRRSMLVRGVYTITRADASDALALRVVDVAGGEAFAVVSI
ncbi:DNA methyltransferase, partial [Roseiflexus sp.]|uniref:DNA methyltransferase n=1 Tax=Roseiflexus sp. TaxID=2562120 RepID=UPI00398AF2F3